MNSNKNRHSGGVSCSACNAFIVLLYPLSKKSQKRRQKITFLCKNMHNKKKKKKKKKHSGGVSCSACNAFIVVLYPLSKKSQKRSQKITFFNFVLLYAKALLSFVGILRLKVVKNIKLEQNLL